MYTNHKEDLAKFKNYHSTQNVATKLARFSNGSTSMPSHSKSGYYKEDIVSYYEGDALQTFLYEDDREFKKLLEVLNPEINLHPGTPAENPPLNSGTPFGATIISQPESMPLSQPPQNQPQNQNSTPSPLQNNERPNAPLWILDS